MIELEHSVVINRPVQEVFSYITEVKNLPTWMTELVDAKLTSKGHIGVGSTINTSVNLLGRQLENTQQLTEYELDSKFAIKSTSGPVHTEDEFIFKPDSDGTIVTRITKGELGGFLKLTEPLIVRMLDRQFDNNFANLKDLLES